MITAALGAYVTYDKTDVKHKRPRDRNQWIVFGGVIGLAVGIVPAIYVSNAMTKK